MNIRTLCNRHGITKRSGLQSAKSNAVVATTATPNKQIARKANTQDKIVVIDPGHGGTDPGAVGAGGTKEKDVALAAGSIFIVLSST